MQVRVLLGRFFALLAALLIFALSAGMAWAIVNDYAVRGLVPKGVTVAGHDLSGLDAAHAQDAIRNTVSEPMMRPMTIAGDGKTWTLEPGRFVSVDVPTMVYEAYSTRRAAPLLARLDSDLRGVPLPFDVQPAYSIDASAVATWVTDTAKEVDRHAVDSSRTIEDYSFKISASANGAKVDIVSSTADIVAALGAQTALTAAERSAMLTVAPIKPKVTESSFGRAIIVSLEDREIRLFDGAKLVKTYPCAPGQPEWPTPTGDFKIIRKQKNAPWINPGSAWAKNMPKVIPGGPNNPMGDTKIAIDYSGVYMHSVPPSEYSSIGSYASHGCMRMLPRDVHDLYKRVKVGEPVYIRE